MAKLSEMSPMNQRLVLSLVVAVIYLIFASTPLFELTSKALAFIPGVSAVGPSYSSLLLHAVVVFLVSWGVFTMANVVYADDEKKSE